jgi:hypothetical protein
MGEECPVASYASCPLEKMVHQHEKDLYHGDEKLPGITTRVLLLEGTMATIKFYGRWLIVMLGGILVTSVMRLVMNR